MLFMYDKTLVLYLLQQIHDASLLVEERFETIKTVDDFTHTPTGKEKLDSICMQLIAIGDGLKKVDKLTDKKLLADYHQIDWTGVKGTRDIIAHHYFDIDAEQIYFICKHHIAPLKTTLAKMLSDLR